MDFFTAQDDARRRTGRLVLLFVLGVIALIAVTTLAIIIALYFLFDSTLSHDVSFTLLLGSLTPKLGPWIAVGVVALVALGGLFKRLELSRGGQVVARALGGREIASDADSLAERRVLNVVEEMAIASGMPVPPVYLLDEPGINAFAAGFDTRDAVIGITQGAIDHLDREELQGVVAHEFSHILHGDMRLNMRLVSVLHGVLMIGLLGNGLLRSARFQPRTNHNEGSRAGSVVMGLGAALMLIGFVGTFFGGWIKAAVSRQREYLADASAVQYTRHPDGIGQALVKIGTLSQGAKLGASRANQFNHMFFGQATTLSFNRLLATHPPLNERIIRVMPDWNGQFDALLAPVQAPSSVHATNASDDNKGSFVVSVTGDATRSSISAMGQPGPAQMTRARQTLDALPRRLYQATRQPFAARALMYALLLSRESQVRQQQLAMLEQTALPETYREVMNHAGEVIMLDEQLRLPLMELALPALKNLSADQAETFQQCLKQLIDADEQVSLFEWSLYQWLAYHLGVGPQARGPAVLKLAGLKQECQALLSLLANAGQDEPAEVKAALTAAEQALPFTLEASSRSHDLKAFSQAVGKLRRLLPKHKQALVNAMARCIEHSGHVRPAEAELMRTIADMLECPVPPLAVESTVS